MTTFAQRLFPLACLTLCAMLPAHAAGFTEAGSNQAWTVSGNASLASQYVSRGFRQTWGKPALQAGVDFVHRSGWSLGSWVSNVSERYVENGKLEWDLYGGYSGSAGDLGYSLVALYYAYPGGHRRDGHPFRLRRTVGRPEL